MKTALVSGASIAGLTMAWWLNQLGYKVTIVEVASGPRVGGVAVDLKANTLAIAARMGLAEQIRANRLGLERVEFKTADNATAGSITMRGPDDPPNEDEIEIERTTLVRILTEAVTGKIEFLLDNSIVEISDSTVTFRSGETCSFDLIVGADGLHSGVRKLWFGHEAEYTHFLGAYSSISIVNKLLVPQNTMQMFNVPNKVVMLNAYNGKTDVVFCFLSEHELAYDYRDTDQQRAIIAQHFAGVPWRTAELLGEVASSTNFYFDKFCQIRMPSWTKGRVALVGDAAYCASPAAGMGGALAMEGAAALADALANHADLEAAFRAYNEGLRPLIDDVQATAQQFLRHDFIPRTEEAIRARNAKPGF